MLWHGPVILGGKTGRATLAAIVGELGPRHIVCRRSIAMSRVEGLNSILLNYFILLSLHLFLLIL
jgi:hypothetical protein